MHIPENYLSPQTCAVMTTVMAPVWYKSIRKIEIQVKLNKEMIPMLGISSSLSFLVMMFNVPVPGGTTAHAVGAVLLSILLGPWAACLSVSITLLLQAILFGDGGILAFGANCFSMAFVMPFVGYAVFHLFAGKQPRLGSFLAGYLGVNAAALASSTLLGLQPVLFLDSQGLPMYNPYPLSITIPTMMGIHLLIVGVVEGVVTTSIYQFIRQSQNKITFPSLQKQIKMKRFRQLILALLLLSPIGLVASGTTWGEWNLSELTQSLKQHHLHAVKPKGMLHGLSFHSIFSDYMIPGLPASISYILCGMTAVILFWILYRLIFERRKN